MRRKRLLTALLVLPIAGCGSTTTSSAPPATTKPAATRTAPNASPAEREAKDESAAEKAHRQKMVNEVIAGHSSSIGPQSASEKRAEKRLEEKVQREAVTAPNSPSIHEQTNPQTREQEARQQTEAIQAYKRAKAGSG